jgi:hypothetical protein
MRNCSIASGCCAMLPSLGRICSLASGYGIAWGLKVLHCLGIQGRCTEVLASTTSPKFPPPYFILSSSRTSECMPVDGTAATDKPGSQLTVCMQNRLEQTQTQTEGS